MAKILMVEDDPKYARLVIDFLSASKHNVDVASTFAEAVSYVDVYDYEVVIVDWQLPDAEGPEFIRRLRHQRIASPIIMLTARDTLADKAVGFDSGADDYLTKDTRPEELLMRIQALLRRPRLYHGSVFSIGDIEIDSNHRVVKKNDQPVHLLPKEYAVIEFLARYSNRVFSSDELLERLWPSDTDASVHTVVSCVNKLRTKLDQPGAPSVILTKYKAGYQINSDLKS